MLWVSPNKWQSYKLPIDRLACCAHLSQWHTEHKPLVYCPSPPTPVRQQREQLSHYCRARKDTKTSIDSNFDELATFFPILLLRCFMLVWLYIFPFFFLRVSFPITSASCSFSTKVSIRSAVVALVVAAFAIVIDSTTFSVGFRWVFCWSMSFRGSETDDDDRWRRTSKAKMKTHTHRSPLEMTMMMSRNWNVSRIGEEEGGKKFHCHRS